MLHPAMQQLYIWFIKGYVSNKKIRFNPKDIFFMNEHGSIWIGDSNPVSERIRTGTYKTLDECLKEDPAIWSAIR